MFSRRYRQCCGCMNNNLANMQNDILEDSCNTSNCSDCACNMDDYVDCCECGFDEACSGFPENPMLAQSYVPIQYMDTTFKPCVGLKMGTIFPELVSPYSPCQSIEEIEYIRATNKIKEGCNKCC